MGSGIVRKPPRQWHCAARQATFPVSSGWRRPPEGFAELRQALARYRADGDARAAVLEGTLAVLTVLGPEAAPDATVAFGTWVTVEDGNGSRSTWRIVGPHEADARRGRISAHSPVGRALLGRAVGESGEVERPGGTAELLVVAVERTPPRGWIQGIFP
jgi:transcription elongation factor GreB